MNRKVLAGRAAVSMAVVGGIAVAVIAGNGNGNGGGNSPPPPPPPPDPYASLPSAIHLTGVVRDFRARQTAGGHPDFELSPTAGNGHYVGMVAENLDSDGKPIMATTGYKVATEWKDASGRNICSPHNYIAGRVGDVLGACSGVQGGALTTSANFAQWYRDVAGVNMSALVTLDLTRTAGTNVFVFDDTVDTHYRGVGFYIVDGRLYSGANGGAQGGNRNYDWTYTIDANFTFKANQGQYFLFSSQDDLWVFVDGKLVVDLGGIAFNQLQRIDLDRLGWLQDGHDFNMKIFYAQRHHPGANLHIETSMGLRSVDPPPVTDQFD